MADGSDQMQQRIETPDQMMSVMPKSRPIQVASDSGSSGLDKYRIARLVIFIALAAFWIVVLRAIF